jgi:hypothetical protein
LLSQTASQVRPQWSDAVEGGTVPPPSGSSSSSSSGGGGGVTVRQAGALALLKGKLLGRRTSVSAGGARQPSLASHPLDDPSSSSR